LFSIWEDNLNDGRYIGRNCRYEGMLHQMNLAMEFIADLEECWNKKQI